MIIPFPLLEVGLGVGYTTSERQGGEVLCEALGKFSLFLKRETRKRKFLFFPPTLFCLQRMPWTMAVPSGNHEESQLESKAEEWKKPRSTWPASELLV